MNKAAEKYLFTLRVMSDVIDSGTMLVEERGDGSRFDREKGRVYYHRMLRSITEARVFDVGSEIVDSVASEVTMRLIKEAGVEDDYKRWAAKFREGIEDEDVGNGASQLIEYAEDELSRVPFPIDLMPFDKCWFGFGNGQAIDDHELNFKKRKHYHNGEQVREADMEWFEGALLVGALVTKENGGSVDAVALVPTPNNTVGFMTIEWARNGRWLDWRTLWSPWLVWAIVNILNDSRQVVASTPGWRREVHAHGRYLKLPLKPKPYYEVVVEPRYIKQKLDAFFTAGAKLWTHRHDRRAHERCRVRRGLLPLSESDRRDMLDRGYAVYEKTIPEGEDARRINLRGFPPKRSDEWIAILPYWVEACIVGPEDLPYVPSVHVVKEAIEHPEGS